MTIEDCDSSVMDEYIQPLHIDNTVPIELRAHSYEWHQLIRSPQAVQTSLSRHIAPSHTTVGWAPGPGETPAHGK